MAKTPKLSEEDQNLFRDAMRGVKKISAQKKVVEPPPPVKINKKPKISEESHLTLADLDTDTELSSTDIVEFNRGGLQDKVLRKLRRGQYNVEDTLDLHGMTVVEARTTLESFLTHCQDNGICSVFIIHGKGRLTGKSILKNKLNLWLKQVPFVLAFCSAKHKDGTSGAMYVLLKNNTRIRRG